MGVLGAGIVALFAEAIANAFEGSGQELLNASVLGAAVVMLMWHNAWMARHGREMAAEMAAVGAAVTRGQAADDRARRGRGPRRAARRLGGRAVPLRHRRRRHLGVLAVRRRRCSASPSGAAFTALTYYGLLSIPARHIFTVTTVLIALLAAGMAAQAVQYLDAAGMIDVLSRRLWDSSGWLPQDGIVGRLLHTLIGYTDRPTELQLIVYLATLDGHGGAHVDRGPQSARRQRPSDNARPSPDGRVDPVPGGGGRSIEAYGALRVGAQHREGDVGRLVDHLEQRAGGAARRTLALLPVAHGLERNPDAGGELRLGELGARAHAAGIGRVGRRRCGTRGKRGTSGGRSAAAHLLRDGRQPAAAAAARCRREESRRSGRRPSV